MTDKNIPLQRMYSKKEIVRNKFVPCSIPTLDRWIRDGYFPPGRKVGQTVFWSESEIRYWQNNSTKLGLKVNREKREKDAKKNNNL